MTAWPCPRLPLGSGVLEAPALELLEGPARGCHGDGLLRWERGLGSFPFCGERSRREPGRRLGGLCWPGVSRPRWSWDVHPPGA